MVEQPAPALTWANAPEWRRLEARQFTASQREALRSWGVFILEPPAVHTSSPTPAGAGDDDDGPCSGDDCPLCHPRDARCSRCGHGEHPRGQWCGYAPLSATALSILQYHNTPYALPHEIGQRFKLDDLYGVSP